MKGSPLNTKGLMMLALVAMIVAGCGGREGATVSEQRADVVKTRDGMLAELYKEKPETKAKVAEAVGYGTFK